MATIPEISQLIIEETLEWQKPLIDYLVCECVDIELSLPLVDNLLIEWEEVIDDINTFFMFNEI
jgi:hypothetical protein